MNKKYLKIILSFLLSFFIIIIINHFLFFSDTPKINQEKIKRNIIAIRNNFTILKNKINYQLTTKEKIDYNKYLSNEDFKTNNNFLIFQPAPTQTPTPTILLSPTEKLIPTLNLTPTINLIKPAITKSTNTIIYPTISSFIISPTEKLQSTKSKKTISLSPTLEIKINPSENNINVPIINNPFSQPYYNPSKAYLCYNNKKFIKVYANNIKPDPCYSNVKKEVEANLTTIKLLGKTITIHKKAYPAFNAVSQELEKNPVAKNYKINTIGAYVFRCNVNATKGNRFNTCNSDCLLSAHSFGIAVDINWGENCNGCHKYNMPIEIVEIFEKYGFRWGGRYEEIFGATIDPMHFEYMYDLCKK